MKPLKTIVISSAAIALAFTSTIQAGEELSSKAIAPAAEAPRTTLTGDWGGLRTDLADKGINIDLRLTQIYQGVASGGIDTGFEYGGVMDYILNIDAEKLGLWKGLAFNIHATSRWGNDISSKAGPLTLAATPLLYPLPGNYSGSGIPGAAVYQTFLDGKAQAFFGKLHAIDLVQGLLPTTTHQGVGGFMNVNALATAMPWFRYINLSQWGGGVWAIKEGMPKYGVIALGQANTTTNWDWDPSWDDGVGLFGFYRENYKIAKKDGYFLACVGGSTKEYPSLAATDWVDLPGAGLVDTGSGTPIDVAAYLYQVLWQGSDKQDVHVLLGGTVADQNPSFSNWSAFGSLEAYGLVASRPSDRMGISGWATGISGDLKNLASLAGTDLRDIWGMEVYYNYEIKPWAHISLDLQLLQNTNPGDDLAIVPGVRMVIDF